MADDKKKQNRRNNGFYGRLFIICLEVFALVVIVGVSLVLLQADEQKQVAKQLKEAGVTEELGSYKVVVNRIEAIHYAMDIAEKDDIIILAGKGHETYQEINGVKHHLDEREEVAAYLKETRN